MNLRLFEQLTPIQQITSAEHNLKLRKIVHLSPFYRYFGAQKVLDKLVGLTYSKFLLHDEKVIE